MYMFEVRMLSNGNDEWFTDTGKVTRKTHGNNLRRKQHNNVSPPRENT